MNPKKKIFKEKSKKKKKRKRKSSDRKKLSFAYKSIRETKPNQATTFPKET